ncbi:MAG: PKD domain-containing protein [Saprospiraceae bacterium]|nr:PKD domain-containing protein [Saprospiraceae bacterium]
MRHANGRDWWMLLPKSGTNRYFAFLVTPEGVRLSHQQEVPGANNFSAFGQAAFSPDGSHLSILRSGTISPDTYVDVFDFDRCSGLLSNFRQVIIPLVSFGVGVAFSPNNRFLYVAMWKTLYQLDLEAPVLDTLIADTWDGFLYTYPNTSWSVPATYGPMVNGPDGRIYSINYNNGHKYLNLIDKPNFPPPHCNARQHALELPTLTGGPPNFAHYRLGPVDGSTCDSLGIDNIPWAWWRYEQDTALYGTIYFTDLSAYEPTQWRWDFGDGALSADTSPVHAYAAPGTYTVCLIVSNAFGADTLCRTIHIATVPAPSPGQAPVIELGMLPNPFRETLTLQWSGSYLPERALCRIYDFAGRQVSEMRVFPGWNAVDASGLSPGVYFWTVNDGGVRLGGGKVVKVE